MPHGAHKVFLVELLTHELQFNLATVRGSPHTPVTPHHRTEGVRMTRRLNVGVVGCGYWGPNLIRNYASLPDCRMKVMCDLSEKRLNALNGRFPGVQQTMDYSDLLEDGELDAIAMFPTSSWRSR